MLFRRFYDDQLAQASYLLGCQATGQALVVDPNRYIEPYLRAAETEGLRITHVTETHIHADFVSGARELAGRTSARLLLSGEGGDGWRYRYAGEAGADTLCDGGIFEVGRVSVRVMHTPGHTPEHLMFVVTDTASATEPMGAFTGDFLFVGEVGRPDLLERAAGQAGTMDAAARQLFRSLRRLAPLPDWLQVWPGHGAGSACGKALGAVPQSTLGYERRFNWAFGVADEDAFVRAVLAGQPEPPPYFAEMKRINRDGPRVLGALTPPPRVAAAGVVRALAAGAIVVDTRPAREYVAQSVPGTINIPAGRAFTTWAGWLLPYDRDLILVVDDRTGRATDDLLRGLAGIGLDRVVGVAGPEMVDDWRVGQGPLQTIGGIDHVELDASLRSKAVAVLDVRTVAEWSAGHLPGAVNIPLGELPSRVGELPRGRPLVVHCQAGGRAAIAASVLRARGVTDLRLYGGGYTEWSAAGHPTASGSAE
jgi:hydroxyacylglutathione hydrolase